MSGLATINQSVLGRGHGSLRYFPRSQSALGTLKSQCYVALLLRPARPGLAHQARHDTRSMAPAPAHTRGALSALALAPKPEITVRGLHGSPRRRAPSGFALLRAMPSTSSTTRHSSERGARAECILVASVSGVGTGTQEYIVGAVGGAVAREVPPLVLPPPGMDEG